MTTFMIGWPGSPRKPKPVWPDRVPAACGPGATAVTWWFYLRRVLTGWSPSLAVAEV